MFGWLERLVNQHKAIRRGVLLWACWLITVVVLRATDPAVLEHVSGAVATIVTAVVGLLATAIGFYHHSRNKDGQ